MRKYDPHLSRTEQLAAVIEIENGSFKLVLDLLNDDHPDAAKLKAMLTFLIEENEANWQKIVKENAEIRPNVCEIQEKERET